MKLTQKIFNHRQNKFMTPFMGSQYHAAYLDTLNLEKQGGNLVTDMIARTSHPRIFAIGDLKVGLNQVVVAAADGALVPLRFGETFAVALLLNKGFKRLAR